MRNRIVRSILFVVAGSVFLGSSFIVLKHQMEMRAGAAQAEALTQLAVVTVSQETESRQTEEIEETELVENRVVAPIQVDFDALLAENPDVIAWLYSPDTPIHYPVVQGEDNAYYINHLLNGKSNGSGTLFLDYRNEADFSHWNSVVYGHNMKNDSMFGTLTDYKKQAYYDAHPKMYLLTPEGDYVIHLVAGLVTPSDSDVYSALYPDEQEKEQLMKRWLSASTFQAEWEPAPEDRYITLSTCSYEYSNARYVLIGVLSTDAE